MTLDIDQCVIDDFHIYISTENRLYELWDQNKYYAWLSEGRVYENNKIIFEWHSKMPSRKTSAEFKIFLKTHFNLTILTKLS
jgi:hypothetical protein